MVSEQEISERVVQQVAAPDGETRDENTNLRLFITGKVISLNHDLYTKLQLLIIYRSGIDEAWN